MGSDILVDVRTGEHRKIFSITLVAARGQTFEGTGKGTFFLPGTRLLANQHMTFDELHDIALHSRIKLVIFQQRTSAWRALDAPATHKRRASR